MLLPFVIYCCNNNDFEDLKGGEYTPKQKQEIQDLADKYGVQLEFVENREGTLQTVQEVENIFKTLTAIKAIYEVPLQKKITSDLPGVPLDIPATRSVQTESGTGNCECSYQIEEGESVTFSIHVSWSVIYQWMDGSAGMNANPTVNFSISISNQSSKKGYRYAVGTVSVSNASIDSSDYTKIEGHTNFTVTGHGIKGTINLQANANVDVKQKSVSCSIGFF